MTNYLCRPTCHYTKIGATALGTPASIALDSNYVHGTGGDAVEVFFVAPETGNLTTVYFYITAVTGTPGNLTVELRNNSSSKPGATLHASQSVSGDSTGWVTCTFDTPYSVTCGTKYWICIGDADGSASHYASVLWKSGYYDSLDNYRMFCGYNTTDGNANVTSGYQTIPFVLKFAGGTIVGVPYTVGANDTSDTKTRGMKITGLTEDLQIIGVILNCNTVNVSGVKIYSGSAAPGDSADYTFTGDLSNYGMWFSNIVTLKKNTVYRVAFTHSGANSAPGYYQIEGTPPDDVKAASVGGSGNFIHTISDGGTPAAWVDTDTKFPRMGLIVYDQVNKNVNLLRGKL